MEITKRFFSTKELTDMGYSRYELLTDSKHPKQDFCTTTSGGGKYRYDLQKYLDFRKKYRQVTR